MTPPHRHRLPLRELMNRRTLLAVAAGVPLGMAFLVALHLLVPRYFYRLPGGGQRCTKCHDLHGGIRLDDLKAEGWIHLTGDVPMPEWIDIARLFREHQIDGQPGIRLRTMLDEYGCADARRIVLVSADGAHVSIDTADLTESARLVPRLNTARFADERIHESAWLWAIVELCVVGEAPPIEINGRSTTFGSLLAGARTTVPTEPGRAVFKDEATGRKYRNVTSRMITGIPLLSLVPASCGQIAVTVAGKTQTLDAAGLRHAILARDAHEGHLMLVLPDKNRHEWLAPITAITAE